MEWHYKTRCMYIYTLHFIYCDNNNNNKIEFIFRVYKREIKENEKYLEANQLKTKRERESLLDKCSSRRE